MSVRVVTTIGESYRLPDSVRDLAGAQSLIEAAEADAGAAGWLVLYGPLWSESAGVVLVRTSAIVACKVDRAAAP